MAVLLQRLAKDLLGNNDPLGEALDLQLGHTLVPLDQNIHCSGDSPEPSRHTRALATQARRIPRLQQSTVR